MAVVVINYAIPADLHRRAKSAAALRGVSLKAFLIAALELAVEEAVNEERSKRPR